MTLQLHLLLFLLLPLNISLSFAEEDEKLIPKFSQFLDSFNLANGFNGCGTWVLGEGFQSALTAKLIPSITSLLKNSTDSKTLGDFFSHEWSYHELKNTVAFGHLKYSRNCAVSLIAWHSEYYVESYVNHFLWKRLTRAAYDYFLFEIVTGVKYEKDSYLLTKLAKRAMLNCESNEGCIVENICSHQEILTITEKCIDFVNRKKFRVATTLADHFLSFETLPGGKIRGRGVQYKMLETAAKYFNHTFGMHVSIGGGTGSRLPNGSCIGTSGEVFHGRGDIGLPLGISLTRQKVIDSTNVFEYTRLTFVYMNPSPQSKWQTLLWPFPTNLWILIGFTFLAVIPVLYMIFIKDTNCSSVLNKLRESVIFAFAIFLEQNSSLTSNAKMSNAFRIMALTWISGSLILGTAYRSKLVSFLTFPFLEDVPNTFQKLADSNYKVNFKFYGGVAYQIFKTSNIPTFSKIYTRLNVEKDLYKCMESVVLQDKTVCVVYLEAASYMSAANFTLLPSSAHSIIGAAKESL